MVHFRVGKLDGVSLEMDKWRKVIEENLGHNVCYLAGSVGKSDGFIIPELSLEYTIGKEIRKAAFSSPLTSKQEELLEKKIQTERRKIQAKVLKFIGEYAIQCLIPNNMFSLPMNLPASLALMDVIRSTKIPTINHNHDFVWERSIYNPSCSLIQGYLDNYFPPDLPEIQHVVINSIAQKNLNFLRGIKSEVIPNVFYFKEPDWSKDSYNLDLKTTLGIDVGDIVVLHATRIVVRKGIELIIDVIEELNKDENKKILASNLLYDGRKFNPENKIILVFPNLVEDKDYQQKLIDKCKELKVDYRFCNNLFAHQRSKSPTGQKIYNLWDSYTFADIISYPSLQEGWGNQFLEAVKAKLPIILFEYAVYKKDISRLGFKTLSLGSVFSKKTKDSLVTISPHVLTNLGQQTIKILQNKTEREKITRHNFEIGLKELSINALGKYLKPYFSSS